MEYSGLSKRHYKRHIFLFILVAIIFMSIHFSQDLWRDYLNLFYDIKATANKNIMTAGRTYTVPNHNTRTDLATAHLTDRIAWVDPGPYHVAYPHNYPFIIDEPKCKTQIPFVVLIVPVAPHNQAARDAIRKTWGNETLVRGKLVQTLFLLGLPGGVDAQQLQEKVQQESEQHRDLLQSNFMDTYLNLTIKTMVMLEWLSTRCSSASYAMKIDSDMFLNVVNLVSMLLAPTTPKQNYMTGLVWWHSPVMRDPSNKFFMPREVVADAEYPPYPLGLGYVMSTDLPKKILQVSPQIKPIYIEDAYLGMCLKRLGVLPTDPPSSSMFAVNPFFAYGRCSLSKVVAVTTSGISQQLVYWEKLKKPWPPCFSDFLNID